MTNITFADVAHQSVSFSRSDPAEALLLELIDNPWIQRLRDVSQTANARLVYMYSEHSRFGHSLGVAYLAKLLMDKLQLTCRREILEYRTAVGAAALLHDLGHLAPGSHTAAKTWFPQLEDVHEDLTRRIIEEDEPLARIFQRHDVNLQHRITEVLSGSKEVPPWTWELISGGGWNADRGNWCIVDSIMAGVRYGEYNISALLESIVITPEGHLALRENRLDAMIHFAVSRHAMYRQIYHHRVMLAADMLNQAVVRRARDIRNQLNFADETMQQALTAQTTAGLSLKTIFQMRESWWKYHLARWKAGPDAVLADLAERLLDRRLLKTVRIGEHEDPTELHSQARAAVVQAGYDPRYYLHQICSSDVHAGDLQQSMPVLMDDGRLKPLSDAEVIYSALVRDTRSSERRWLCMPKEAKDLLGRAR